MIDSHLHLWDSGQLDYDWLHHVPAIAGRHGPEDFVRLDRRPSQAVFVQADCAPTQALAEVDWVVGLAPSALDIPAIVAFAPLETGAAVQSHLDALQRRPQVRGVRRSTQNEADGFLSTPAHIDGMVAAAERGLTLDVCVRDRQLPELVKGLEALFARVPSARVVLDHLGKPDIALHGGDVTGADWADNLKRLAALPQVFAKISGLTTQDDWATGRDATLRPYIDHALACFSSDRLMFGGDWPVVDLAGGYGRWLTIFDQATAHLSAEDRERLSGGVAADVYRIPPSPDVQETAR